MSSTALTNSPKMPPLNASSRIMYEEAISQGIDCTTFEDHETILMKRGSLQWYVRGSRTSLQSSVGKTIADQKPLTKRVLHHFGLPTAPFAVITKAEDVEQLAELQFPVVTKPTAARHGEGVRVGVKDAAEVKAIWEKAQQTLIVEEMLQGIEYRILCIDYQFFAAAYRKPAFVVGDGSKTIQELIELKNQHPWRGEGHQNNLSLIKTDELVTAFLTEQNLTLTSVPTAGQEVVLRKTANLSTGGEAWNVTEEVSEENRQLFTDIAKACDLHVAGIDVMCQNLTNTIVSQPRAGIIEVNASPGLRMHHFPLKGEPVNAAKAILDSVQRHYE